MGWQNMVNCAALEKPWVFSTLVGSNPTPTAKFMVFNFFKKKKGYPLGQENLKEILVQFGKLKEELEIISKELENLKKENEFNVQKIGIVRFNPFQEIGGNQSFSLALLNGNDNGVVITSLYSREGNRVYGKPIKNGGSEYPLSEEEKKAIEQAKNWQNLNSQTYGSKNPKLNSKTTGGGDSGPC